MSLLPPRSSLRSFAPAVALSLIAMFVGCKKPEAPAAHHHDAPHGGTLVELGEHEFNLEFVYDFDAECLNAFIFDAHASEYVRIPAERFQVVARMPAGDQLAEFTAVANTATGETVGNTAQFRAKADWLKSGVKFDGVLKSLEIRDKKYENVAFKFPQFSQ
ncbi:MAG TPA: hypothetical protein VI454_02090 [Verrucomicrobiae bacterium]|jgi:hypothetical protein